MMRFMIVIGLSLIVLIAKVSAQNIVSIPNLEGLTLPQAASSLNRQGLRLGIVFTQAPDPTHSHLLNRVYSQNPRTSAQVTLGSAVDLTILRESTLHLVYDDNDITLINTGNEEVSLRDLTFYSAGRPNTQFNASDWLNTLLRSGRCIQLWSVSTNAPHSVPNCESLQRWLSRTTPDTHFWTGSNGATYFEVRRNSLTLAYCSIGAGTCAVPTQAPNEITNYVTFSYSADQFYILNTSSDQWMQVADLRLMNGTLLINPRLFEAETMLGSLDRLAPAQCLLLYTGTYTGTSTSSDAAENCHIIGQAQAPSNFWRDGFSLSNRTTCPQVPEQGYSLCILPN